MWQRITFELCWGSSRPKCNTKVTCPCGGYINNHLADFGQFCKKMPFRRRARRFTKRRSNFKRRAPARRRQTQFANALGGWTINHFHNNPVFRQTLTSRPQTTEVSFLESANFGSSQLPWSLDMHPGTTSIGDTWQRFRVKALTVMITSFSHPTGGPAHTQLTVAKYRIKPDASEIQSTFAGNIPGAETKDVATASTDTHLQSNNVGVINILRKRMMWPTVNIDADPEQAGGGVNQGGIWYNTTSNDVPFNAFLASISRTAPETQALTYQLGYYWLAELEFKEPKYTV